MYGQWGVPGYTEVRELGTGASGRVVLATRDHDGGQVAIKYLSDELRADVGFVARFRHEARLLGTMRSEHNARLVDYVETGEGAAIVMELVNGVSLRELLASEGPTGPEAALTVLKGSLQGLAAAHSIGVVHRDYKPENVIVQGDGTSKLVDFGIAVRAGQGASAAGTPPYMAPEQWSGAASAPTTDVYAATIVFFECLTGTRPYRAPNLAALAAQHHSTPPPIDDVPVPLQGLVERGLAKHPSERPPSAEAFLTELEAIAAEAYGDDWEERGRRRLARLAGLLLMLFPLADETLPETSTTMGESAFREPTRLMAKMGTKVAIGAVCMGVLVVAAVVAVKVSSDEPTLQAQTSTVSPSSGPSPLEVATTPEETEEAEPTAEETTPEPDPTDTTTPTATTLPQAATPTPTPSPSKTPKPTPRVTKKPTKKPTPTETPDEGITGRSSGDETEPPATRSSSPPPTTTAPTTTAPAPTVTRSTSRPTQSTTDPEPTKPTSTRTSTDDESDPETPRFEKVPAAVLAFGLMTSGAVPVTLAVKRRMAGRHRRKR
ncbi:serine/threonine protein kinase [Nonomuraea sp. NBC_01738]|uniref:serine/threonine-protein kinase n=1 Tax=Nonomuraea sp. NBC_01738 TaxID=2976003 RepID=UPI002E126764|nr:serine/threonine protein kinase [Nonomuraea sp. NBC_01738]